MKEAEEKMTGYASIDKPWLKYYSDEAVSAPLPECTIYEYLWENNKEYFDSVALNYFGRRISFGELFDRIEKAAKAFTAIGIRQGDTVIMVTVTTPETIYALYGLNRIGAIANMVDPRTSVEGIKEYISEANAKYILTIEAAYSKIEKAVIGFAMQKIIVISPADSLFQPSKFLFNVANYLKGTASKLSNICLRWNDFISNGDNIQPKYAAYQRDTCCVIVHTGGTTGTPKGVMLSNDNLNAAAFQGIITGIDLKREHTWLNIMPPFIAYGIGNGLHLPLAMGMETILIPQFDPAKFADLLNKYKPNHMVGVPSHYNNIIHSDKMKNADLSYIIAPTVGGDSMRSELEKETNEFLAAHNCSYQVSKGYGMTEVCAAVSICVSNECNEVGMAGIPFTHTIISIFDIESGEELTYGERGEICITGPNTMLGYYNNQVASAEIMKIHKDGKVWVHSGDIGYMTEKGFLYVVGRIKRMIIRHDGFKVFPTFIENVVTSHSAVSACCVVGIEDKNHGQGRLPIAYIVLSQDNRKNEDKIRQELVVLCEKELPEYA
ncbi:MAG: acyl--CoA ligase [Roseburia sp.]|nr:acyl--CoA ligase [Roseburia sp.]